MNVFELFGTIAIKNRDANNALNDTAQKAERTGKRIQEAFKKVGAATLKIGKGVAAGVTAIGTAFAATVEKTRDYRTAMGKLETAYVTNGHSAETALKTYRALQSVLGDTDQAVEAANHLAVLCKNEEDLAKWTDICTGVYATFGDSLPIEGLTESANETAKVGQVTGSLADALNWAGISEEDFNLKLRACRTEQERQNLIVNHLTHAYKGAADQYKETAANVIAANEAQEKLNAAMAKLGEIGEPIMTGLKNWVADMVNAAVPHIESIVTAFSDLGGTWENQVWPMLQEDFKAAFGVELPDWATTSQNIKDWWTNVTTTVGDIFKSMFEVDLPSASEIAGKISDWWSGIKSSISGMFNIDIGANVSNAWSGVTGFFTGGKDNADSSSAVGLDRVPRDGYLIRAHKDETLLNKTDADIWHGGGSGRIEALLSQLVANTSGGQQIVLESGVLVGQIASQMDARLGTISSRKGRGN